MSCTSFYPIIYFKKRLLYEKNTRNFVYSGLIFLFIPYDCILASIDLIA
jgi:hypothetical protein